MLTSIIDWSLRNRILVLIAALLAAWFGWRAMTSTPLDAIPDLSDVQVIVKTPYAGQAPQLVEEQVTWPLANLMLAVPGATQVRGYSFFGDSYLYILFEEGTDIYWARSRVLEYLNQASERLPEGVTPRLGPDASGVGWVFQYALVDRTGQHHLGELTSLQDWFLKQELQSVAGVSEVATVGGMVQAYQVVVEPRRLQTYGLTLEQVQATIVAANQEVGGGIVEMAEAEYMVRGTGYIQSLDDLRTLPLPVQSAAGTNITLADVATIRRGPESRRGIAELNGEGEVVGGIVVMRHGENALATIERVRDKLKSLQQGLPAGVEIVPTYDRSELIHRAVDNLTTKLLEEMGFVALVTILFLLHIRSAMVAIITLPLAVLMSFIVMRSLGINANIMSLGGIAIAIGALVDAAIVMVENAHKHLEHYREEHGEEPKGATHWQLIRNATVEVGPALFLSLLIITLSFVPVFSLEAQEGRLFAPLAYTKTFAMAAAALLAITLVPVLMGYFVRGKIISEQRNPLTRCLIWIYRPVLHGVLAWPKLTVVVAVIVAVSGYYPLSKMGSEFMPTMQEGDLLYMPTTLPGISPGAVGELLQRTDRLIKQVPEVESVFGKTGRADTATDPAPLTMLETTIQLKPESEWREGMTLQKIIEQLDATVRVPGITNAWVQPIKTRIDMLSTGLKTPLGLKIAGPELAEIQQIGSELEQRLNGVPGVASVFAERPASGRYLEIRPRLDEAARYGINQAAIQRAIRFAIGGAEIAETVEGTERYPITLRYPRALRDHVETIKQLPIASASGTWVTLEQVADVEMTVGPAMIRSENARPTGWVFIDVDPNVAVGDVIAAAEPMLADYELPPRYSLSWSGQYESMQRVEAKLKQVVPVTLAVILILLYLTFRSFKQAALIMATLPLALTGSLWFIWWLDYNLSIAVMVGMIALAGVAAEFGVVMLLYLNNAWKDRKQRSRATLYSAIEEGAVLRVRPKAMTVITIIAGLLPIMLTHGTGSEVMQRIAAPMIGGMILAPLLSLLLLPAVYLLWHRRKLS
ncbi:efflux RND transporter permease subunit [Pseudidiomarina sp. 1APP75-32.1]|uniref:Efflux RND transporter permease subunit n=1 Tax=Pseudidiomarina terrestris TaxID=2820060 RepID=A0AAW7QWV2_9GAMM|nr:MULTISPECIES: CusA/CzcA family heavy metal efflux RND transporter [unclassified Pseudidiomarina]MDN7124363.1 efflux RND transporter permease subunit [Pseudidiomarina sp. 1APP75-32.1]MDN7126364.1 efflux RND transporter permease subunit [Pseudidiomarina sp. 1APR75-33.1]MDN7129346.1 efflux RND transporter permease subunit [Pseudidiomarina sp. 1APR75-15]